VTDELLPSRRDVLRWLALTSLAFAAAPRRSRAANSLCPSLAGRRLHWIVPNSPGGGYDTYSRLIAPHFAGNVGAEIVVQNMPGAGGIIGARHIRDSSPDGKTMGILNGPGMLIANILGEAPAPDPLTDFAVLGRVARSRHVWATGGNSPFSSIEDALESPRGVPLLFAVDEVATTSFVCAALAASLLPVEASFLSGFPGSRQTSLAVMRGDADLISNSFESILDRIEAGDLRPLLQISASPIADHPSLEGVPLLGGERGLAALFARERGVEPAEARADARGIINLVGAGRLVVAPRGLPPELFACMEEGLHEALGAPELVEAATAARRSLDTARADKTAAELRSVKERSSFFLPILRRALESARR